MKQSIHLAKNASYDEASYKVHGTHSPKKTYFHLYGQNQITLDVYQKIDKLQGCSPFEVATSAYGKHASQHQYTLVAEDFGVGDCRLFGLYKSCVGYDSATNNIFAGIE